MCPQDPYTEATRNVAKSATDTPKLVGGEKHAGVMIHEVDGALIALGRVPFPKMIRAVLEHTGAPDEGGLDLRHRIVQRLTYRTVSLTQTKGDRPIIDWDNGLTQITAYRPMT